MTKRLKVVVYNMDDSEQIVFESEYNVVSAKQALKLALEDES